MIVIFEILTKRLMCYYYYSTFVNVRTTKMANCITLDFTEPLKISALQVIG